MIVHWFELQNMMFEVQKRLIESIVRKGSGNNTDFVYINFILDKIQVNFSEWNRRIIRHRRWRYCWCILISEPSPEHLQILKKYETIKSRIRFHGLYFSDLIKFHL
jgi:hypothetical protein